MPLNWGFAACSRPLATLTLPGRGTEANREDEPVEASASENAEVTARSVGGDPSMADRCRDLEMDDDRVRRVIRRGVDEVVAMRSAVDVTYDIPRVKQFIRAVRP